MLHLFRRFAPAFLASPAPSEKPEDGRGRRRRRTLRAWLIDVYAALDSHPRAVRLTLLATVAGCVGLLVAPDLRLRAYPADPALIGAPMTENIKAPYDLEVVDQVTTERLRDDAEVQVRPVFDFDRECAARDQARIARAFRLGRAALANDGGQGADVPFGRAPSGSRPGPAASPTERTLRARFEEAWGTPLPDGAWRALLAQQFVEDMERVLVGLARDVQAEPLVATRNVLEVGRESGVVLERIPMLPANGHDVGELVAATNVVNIGQISDVDVGRRKLVEMGAHMSASGALPGPLASVGRELGMAAASLLEANVTYNRHKTEQLRAQARHSVRPVAVAIKKGEMIVRDGERLSERQLMVLAAFNAGGQSGNVLTMAMGGVVLLLVLCALSDRLTGFLRQDVSTLASRDLTFLTSLFLLSLVLSRAWLYFSHGHDRFGGLPREALLYLLPVAFAPMVTRLVLRAEIALMFCVLHSLVLGLLADGDRMLMIYALCGSVAATGAIHSISSRSDLLRAGFFAGLTQAVAAFGIQLFESRTGVGAYLWPLLFAMAGGVAAAVLALSLTPAIEWAFDYTTDLKLLELANLNHPALKELIVQAPGSYHHSIIVGALVEAAAENIAANPLLARVMAYYHDLGKGCNPGYFIENQRSGQNPHDKLKPSMSAMIIRRHVTDGIELAKRHGLGEQILAGIAQHHGNTLIRVFFHKAQEIAEPGQTIAEADYRYPGIKPQSREAALVMLGDSIEAASRALSDPSAARLTGLVQRIINDKFTDGQLDECDLTLRDLHTIAKSFSRVLLSIYHHRLEYPDGTDTKKIQAKADHEAKARKATEDARSDPMPGSSSGLKRLGL